MLYFIKTRQVNEICYAIEAENLTPEIFLNYIKHGALAAGLDFSTEYQDEVLEDFSTMSQEEYLKLFDEKYPQFKEVNVSQKLFNIRQLNEDELIEVQNGEERDQL